MAKSIHITPIISRKIISKFVEKGLNADLAEKIVSDSELIELRNKETLLAFDEVCSHIFFIINGGFITKSSSKSPEGEKAVNFFLDTFRPLMTCFQSYFKNEPSKYRIEAMTTSRVLKLNKKYLRNLVNVDDDVFKFFNRNLIQALLTENAFRESLISSTSAEFYQSLMTEYPDVIEKVPSKYIADFMGITGEWLSKLKSKQRKASTEN